MACRLFSRSPLPAPSLAGLACSLSVLRGIRVVSLVVDCLVLPFSSRDGLWACGTRFVFFVRSCGSLLCAAAVDCPVSLPAFRVPPFFWCVF